MTNVMVKVKLPALSKRFTAKYSVVRKPTGVEYMLLTTIGMESLRTKTWEDVMNIYGIPEEVFEFVYRPALERMSRGSGSRDSKMIDLSADPDFDSLVSKAKFTTAGRQAFEKGVIADEIDDVTGTIVNVPAQESKKYLKDSKIKPCSMDGIDTEVFDDIVPDDMRAENAIIVDKTDYGVPKNADIFDVVLDKDFETFFYEKDIVLALNEVTGTFTVSPRDLDENFLKNRFNADDLIDLIPPAMFTSPTSDFKITDVRSEMPDWEKYSVHLPCDINVKGSKMVLVNNEFVSSEKYKCFDKDIGCDILSIISSSVGYEYCLVNKTVTVDGYGGISRCNLAIRRSIDKDTIASIVKAVVGDMDISTLSGFKQALSTISVLEDTEASTELVKRYLLASNNLRADLLALQEYRKTKWYSGLPETIEDVIIEKNIDVKEAASILTETKTVTQGRKLVSHYFQEDESENLMTADLLYPNLRNPSELFKNLKVENKLVDDIIDGGCREYNSKLLAAAANLSRTLGPIREKLRIRSPSSIEMDLDSLTNDDRKDIVSKYQMARGSYDTISQYIRGADRFRELEYYINFMGEITNTLKGVDQGKILDKGDDRTFGINLGVLLESNLKEMVGPGTLADNIAHAYELKLISDKEYKILDEFREFRNRCAHDPLLPDIEPRIRKLWKDTIESIHPIEAKEE